MMRDVGYRVKINPKFLMEFFEFYTKSLNSLEIKLTKDMLHASCMEHVTRIAAAYEFKHLSFHAPKKAFYTEVDYNLLLLFLNSSNEFSGNIFVTHFYSDISYKAEYIDVIIENAKAKNVKVAIENVEMTSGLLSYLTQLKNFAIQYKTKVCLDIGHLLYSANRCNIKIEALLSFFQNDIWWTENVIEFHMHDFNNVECHLNIGKGMANFDDIAHLLAIFEASCPIILETTVSDLSTQGVSEIALFKRLLHEF